MVAKKKSKYDFLLDDYLNQSNVEENWNLKVLDAQKVRAVVKLTTTKGIFALKKVDHKMNKLRFMYEAKAHLFENGFTKHPYWVKTIHGEPFSETKDGMFLLISWVDGTESDLKDNDQLLKIMRLQAEFHQASKGFSPSIHAQKDLKWDLWIEKYEKLLNKWQSLYKTIENSPKKDKNHITAFLETAKPMLEMTEKTITLLKESPYQQVSQREKHLQGFVHGDFAYHNFIQAPNGEMNVIDFDYSAQNLRMYDFAHFFRKVMHRTEWDIETSNNMLRAYHEVNPIHEDELAVLKAVMHYPNRYWRAVDRTFISKRYSKKEGTKKLRKEMEKFDSWIRYLESFPTTL